VTGIELHQSDGAARSPDRDTFVALSSQLYVGDRNWAPGSTELADECFDDAAAGEFVMHPVLAVIDGEVLARAAAFMSPPRDRPPKAPPGWIGLLECRSGFLAAGVAVLHECRRWLAEQGAHSIVAPRVNALVAGLLCEGFDQPQSFLTPYNPAWYSDILTTAGFHPTTSMVAFEFTRDRPPSFTARTNRGFRVRPVELTALADEVSRIHRFQEDVFAGHPGHQTRSLGQTHELAARLLPHIDPGLVIVAEDEQGTTIGVLLCVPDVWQRRPADAAPTRARLISLGVRDSWRRQGVATAMGAALTKTLLANGYTGLEASVVMTDNEPPQRLAGRLGARVTRRFQLYEWTDKNGPA
jgi:GNAT superfamily N-acetyltransferase